MSTFKRYAKQAKERMKSGFWENAKARLEHEKQVAATYGLDCHVVGEEQRRKLEKQIYDYDGFCEEQEFYCKVEKILESDCIVSNPIMQLADQRYMDKLSAYEKQTYLMKLSSKYQAAVEKYNRLHG